MSEPRPLAWHEGTHPLSVHGGYPRHQHSMNGALTIDPKDYHQLYAQMSAPTTQWWEATLWFRIPDGEHRVTEGSIRTGIQAPWENDPGKRRETAMAVAEQAFRDMGLGPIMRKKDQPGARVSLTVSPA